jgi:hypothetical protein
MRAFPLALAACIAVAGCERTRRRDDREPPRPDPWQPRDAGAARCESLPFADSIPLAEASGAAWNVAPDGTRSLLVIADSGNHGAYELVDPATGVVRADGVLPLGDGAGDDLEGVAVGGGALWALTSAGWMRFWHAGNVLGGGPYPISDQPGFTCAADGVNCGKNYEGLCVHPSAGTDGILGFAASKADGRLWCLRADARGWLVIDPRCSIQVAPRDGLADCAFSPDGKILLAGGNVRAFDMVWRVDGWRDPARATVSEVGDLIRGNAEAIAVDDDGTVYRFSDLNTAPSLAGKFRCPQLAR